MKHTKTLCILVATFFATSLLNAQFIISSDPFSQALTNNWSDPVDGSIVETASVTDASLFATQFIGGIGNVDIYKTSGGNPSDWAASSNAQTFTINVVGTPTAHGSNLVMFSTGTADSASNARMRIKVNGTEYWLLATTNTSITT